MKAPDRLAKLPKYTFDRLRDLLGDASPGRDVIDLSLGEPRHAYPVWIFDDLMDLHHGFGRYPPSHGTRLLRESISAWISLRYGVNLDPDRNIIVCNGSREGLFSACMALCPEKKQGSTPLVLMPNPFYQVYAGAALSAGAIPYYVPATEDTDFLPDYTRLDTSILNRTAIVFICSPSNPQGAVASRKYLVRLLRLAETHDFKIISDECYSEIYRHDPPTGMLELFNGTYNGNERIVVLNSLSKRSSLPGIRSGFMAAGERTVNQIKHFRSYNEPAPTIPLQEVSARAWKDEYHVDESRSQYRRKYELADEILEGFDGYRTAKAGIFLWINVGNGEKAALELWKKHGIKTVPGRYFTQVSTEIDPGRPYIRVALVAREKDLKTGLGRICEYMKCR